MKDELLMIKPLCILIPTLALLSCKENPKPCIPAEKAQTITTGHFVLKGITNVNSEMFIHFYWTSENRPDITEIVNDVPFTSFTNLSQKDWVLLQDTLELKRTLDSKCKDSLDSQSWEFIKILKKHINPSLLTK